MHKLNSLYFIDDQANTGKYNMLLDEEIFNKLLNDEFNFPVLRLYTWSEDTISLGYNQKELNSVQLPTVKRITGGQAVFHSIEKNELTYSYFIKTDLKPKAIYNYLGNIFIRLLQKYSLNAGFGYKNTKYRKSFNCFESMTEADIVINNIKIIGSAQRVKRKSHENEKKQYILQHGSIKLDKINLLSSRNISNTILKEDLKKTLSIDYNINLITCTIKENNEIHDRKI